MIYLYIYLIGSVLCFILKLVADIYYYKVSNINVHDLVENFMLSALSWIGIILLLYDMTEYIEIWRRKK